MLLTASRAEAALQVGLDSPEMAITDAAGEMPEQPEFVKDREHELQVKDVSSNASSSPTMLGTDSVSMPVVEVRRLGWIDDAVDERFWPLEIGGVPRVFL